jgi:hypothetical protein
MPTYTQIGSAQIAGSGGATSLDFTSIPATYTDLVLKISARSTTTSDWVTLKFNSNTTGYSNRHLQGTGSTAGSFNQTTWEFLAINNQSASTSNTFSSSEVYIPNYAGSTNKSYSVDTAGEANATAAFMELNAQLWSNTAAITSISITSLAGNLAQHTTAYLYGVSNA